MHAKKVILEKMVLPKLEKIRDKIEKRSKKKIKPEKVKSKVKQYIDKTFVEYDVLKETFNLVQTDIVKT